MTEPYRCTTGSLVLILLLWIVASVAAPAQSEPEPTETVSGSVIDSLRLRQIRDSIILDSLKKADTLQPQVRFGTSLGANFSTARIVALPVHPTKLPGINVAFRSELEFAHPLYFGFDIAYSERGLRSRFQSSSGEVIEDFEFNYLNAPIFFKLMVLTAAPLSINVSAGVSPGFLLSSTQSLRLADQDTVLVISNGIERYDFGLDFRTGIEYLLSPRISLLVEGEYLHGLQNIFISKYSNDPRSWIGRTVTFSLGFYWQLQRSIRKAPAAAVAEP